MSDVFGYNREGTRVDLGPEVNVTRCKGCGRFIPKIDESMLHRGPIVPVPCSKCIMTDSFTIIYHFKNERYTE